MMVASDGMMCPHCGVLCQVVNRLTVTHNYPPFTRQVCRGSGQIPRYAFSDARKLWNGEPNRYFGMENIQFDPEGRFSDAGDGDADVEVCVVRRDDLLRLLAWVENTHRYVYGQSDEMASDGIAPIHERMSAAANAGSGG